LIGSSLDLALLVAVLVFAFSGYRRGLLVGVLSFVGFFGGALLGVQLGPHLAERVGSGIGRLVVGVVLVIVSAAVGQAIAVLVGSQLRKRLPGAATRTVDSLGGAIVSVISVLLVVWMVAAPLSSAPVPWLASQIRRSTVIKTVDEVMPGPVRQLYDSFRSVVARGDFPEVFGRLVPTRVRPVGPPDTALAGSPVVATVRRSVVKVVGVAPSCSRRLEGSGFVFAPHKVMTNAHVVAGVRTLTVQAGNQRYDGRVVVYDPERDVAVLDVPQLDAPPLRFDGRVGPGASAIVLGYPLDGPYTAVAARVREVRSVTGPDIYNRHTVTREVYTLRATVRSGNSGGPLLSTSGTVDGVVFAAAVDEAQTGFALTAAEVAPDVARANNVTPVSTGGCD
jgi:S1-C subfamily serine protease